MKKIIKLFCFTLFFICSCKTNELVLTASPEVYYPKSNITNSKQLLEAYSEATIKIIEWQIWYNNNVTNLYKYNKYNK